MKRVLMTGDTVGGVWTFTLELAEALGPHGVEVVLAAMGGAPGASQRAEAAAIPNLRLVESGYKLEWMQDPWQDVLQAGAWLLDLEQAVAPDIVHLNSYGHGALPWSAPTVLTGHSCVLSWWAAVKGEPAPAEWDRYRALVSEALAAAKVVTAPTLAMLAALEEHYGGLPHGRVILNGRQAARFRPARKELLILSAGRLWDEAKNVRALAQIADTLAWPVYLAGDAQSACLPGCRMLGRLSSAALAQWLGRAAIYALPARYEPFGLSVLEAALCGCALVLGDIPSLREVWEDAAFYVHPDDAVGLRSALLRLMVDGELRGMLVQRGLRRARQLTPGRMAEQFITAYHDAVTARQEVEASCAS